jgi:hypothetical protein
MPRQIADVLGLLARKPAFRIRAGRSLRMFSGVILPPAALARRPKITFATRPLNCW